MAKQIIEMFTLIMKSVICGSCLKFFKKNAKKDQKGLTKGIVDSIFIFTVARECRRKMFDNKREGR